MLVGTPEYMSPEQAGGGHVDYRTDLYALGVVLFQMLTGAVPFRSTTPHATLHAVIYEPPPRPRQIMPSLSPAIETVILQSIAKQPEQRFQRGAALTAALQAAISRPGAVRPPPPGPPPPSSPSLRSRRASPLIWILAAMATLLVLILVGLVLLVLGGGGDSEPGVDATQAIVVVTSTPGMDNVTPTQEQVADLAPSTTVEWTPTESPLATPTVPAETEPPVPPTSTPLPPTKEPTVAPTATLPPTPPPTLVPTASPTVPTCGFPAQGEFAALWQTYRGKLGCPVDVQPKIIQDAEQPFEQGHMFWRADSRFAYVVYQSGAKSGTFQMFNDMWEEGDPDYSCQASPPPGRIQPKRGFGAVWCALGGPNAPIGWGLEDEVGKGAGNGDPMVQDFETGVIFRDSDGTMSRKAYILFSDGTFTRVAY